MISDKNNKDKVSNEAEHTERISSMFSSIAGKYDLLNRVHSFRRDVAWRRFTSRKMKFQHTKRYLDIATGTADLALETLKQHPGVSALGIDPVEELMEIGRKKASGAALAERLELRMGNALDLDLDDNSFDVAAVAFGIRNIKDRAHALREMTRVVVPGGQVMVLELTFTPRGILKPFYDLYLNKLMPFGARLLSKNPEAYIYLAKSIMDFPSPEKFKNIMLESGLDDVMDYSLTFGVARLFVGYKKA
jgi:demethylmenaquinone methyltransferase/2-methoxy-6-polyprenyl-1,4-benzoquinol methylase